MMNYEVLGMVIDDFGSESLVEADELEKSNFCMSGNRPDSSEFSCIYKQVVYFSHLFRSIENFLKFLLEDDLSGTHLPNYGPLKK